MAWIQLFIAGLLEVVWAVGMKKSEGFTKLAPSVWTVLAMIASMWLLTVAANKLPLGTAYAVWTGIGVLGTTVLGMILFDEPRDAKRILCITLILVGIVGLKLMTVEKPPQGA
jgi:quaternary ammonium compound-resistance protein SugE